MRLETLGCRLNEAELEAWSREFERRGFHVVGAGEPAALVVVNTCAVTQEAVRKSRQILRRAHRADPSARLLVSGCLAALESEALARESGVDLVVTNGDKDRLVGIALEALSIPAMPELAIDEAASLFARGRQRAFLKVQDGCRYQCTFCITTQARGEERSRPIRELVETVGRLAGQGLREIVLTGVHLGGYGSDLGTDLAALIRRLLDETDIRRIRLGSLEPWDLPEGFWHLFEDGRLMPHLHLPLQSGSDEVLRRMARRCKTDAFARLVGEGRAAVPDLNLTTDIIVGFPGETRDDWRRTLDLVRAMRFGHIHVFSFSPRAGTLAAGMPNRVDAETRKRRCQELQALAEELRRDLLQEQIGRRASVLFEGPPVLPPDTGRTGYTPNYLPVRLAPGLPIASNQLVEVHLTGVDPDGSTLIAELLDDLDGQESSSRCASTRPSPAAIWSRGF
ncbi:tRNA (N(6)-L-threonylcarbamoyladenosine(37)-C(2))-methylthiotransferase MtaB [Imhoffiella purpurea]|uniref:MiaB family protein, possibly involved in tRNA or rRNA modification n=1 Tax=Imhoffiella purpurea TaxID=1249627 RepID=W9VSB6_9GAMM|nr:tRNA (N(6)-L-threonylcarbamoyladenosine(37)-C(2))-methylthiotransferase MtaB [Imhoffiella purpurea]EXJ13300.1 MiaB family protein, possibly involved in tRNA or rRNA modification [Imhoffiella purpurea]